MSMDILAKSYQQIVNMYNSMYFAPPKTDEVIVEKQSKYTIDSFVNIDKIWNDALAMLEANQFYAISIVGPQGSGKTSIASEIMRRSLAANFKVVYAQAVDFIDDVEGWIDRVTENPRAKNCLVIDDLSYAVDMQSRKNQAIIKNLVAKFRHVFGGQLLVIYITHRLHAAPPMLRNSGSWIFSAMQTADRDDARKVIGNTKSMKDRLEVIYKFISEVSIEGVKNGIVRFYLGDDEVLFRWGTKENHGDGRLMACYHGGKLDIFHSQIKDEELDLEKFRCKKPIQ
jgi:predicted phosphatase